MENMDIAVIGAGFSGMTAALYAARAGARVMLFEKAAEMLLCDICLFSKFIIKAIIQ